MYHTATWLELVTMNWEIAAHKSESLWCDFEK